jgi:hypothetical protein
MNYVKKRIYAVVSNPRPNNSHVLVANLIFPPAAASGVRLALARINFNFLPYRSLSSTCFTSIRLSCFIKFGDLRCMWRLFYPRSLLILFSRFFWVHSLMEICPVICTAVSYFHKLPNWIAQWSSSIIILYVKLLSNRNFNVDIPTIFVPKFVSISTQLLKALKF